MKAGRVLCVLVVAALTAGSVSATMWSVDPSGSCSDSSCTPCCTIQGAVLKSSGGDVISVAPGTYPENVDLSDMASVGNITLEAASGPGTVLVAPASGHTLRHSGDTNHNLVTIDGIDFSSGAGSSCVYLNHHGGAVLYDVNASNCGYTAFLLDNTGNITMRRCTANSNDRHGIQIDGASGAYLEDCTTNSNTMDGVLIINIDAMAELVNPTAVGNGDQGLDFDVDGYVMISGATVTDNAGRGIWAWVTTGAYIASSDIQGSGDVGVDIDWNGVDPVEQVTLINTTVSNNGFTGNDSGVRLRNVVGPVTVTDCDFDNNAFDGLSVEASVVGDVELAGGHANGNGDDGYDLRAVGEVTIGGVTASNNAEYGVTIDAPGVVTVTDSIANGNLAGSGFNIFWQDPDPLDEVKITGCTANGNIGSGVLVSHAAGPVKILGTTTDGNSSAGVRVDHAAGSVLVRKVVSTNGLAEGIKVNVDAGPVTVVDSAVTGNASDGVIVNRDTVDVAAVIVQRNLLSGNGSGGVTLFDLTGGGPFNLMCNDVVGNGTGVYLDSPVTVMAQRVWWGDPTGPSGQGPGAGDGIYAEAGGTILHDPWLPSSHTTPGLSCPTFGSNFESGTLDEWDASSP